MKKLDGVLGKVAELRERSRKQVEVAERTPIAGKPVDAAKEAKLPMWPDAVRGVPNMALRSSLFGAVRKGKRAYLERVQIHAQDGIEIRYTGGRLDQGDLDVWEAVLHIARLQALGDECRVTAYQLLKSLGKTDAGSNRATLDKRLSRMKATGVDVKVGRHSYEGSLIDEVYRDVESREYVIRLNPKLRALYEADQYTQIEAEVRHELDGQPLAQWLHGYYASHAKPYPVRVETLHRLCGSEASSMTDFAKNLRKSLDAVSKASEAHGEGFSYEIRGDLVHVVKVAKGAQRRHLAKRPRAPKTT